MNQLLASIIVRNKEVLNLTPTDLENLQEFGIHLDEQVAPMVEPSPPITTPLVTVCVCICDCSYSSDTINILDTSKWDAFYGWFQDTPTYTCKTVPSWMMAIDGIDKVIEVFMKYEVLDLPDNRNCNAHRNHPRNCLRIVVNCHTAMSVEELGIALVNAIKCKPTKTSFNPLGDKTHFTIGIKNYIRENGQVKRV